ncbi:MULTISPECIES: sensor histidine kinase [Bifidobacterium]|nr:MULTISPECIES: histidine kinase [Bifidobacterium]
MTQASDNGPAIGTKRRWTIVMVVVSMLDALVQTAYAANHFQYIGDDLGYVWCVLGLVGDLAAPFLLLRRGARPVFCCLSAAVATLLLPFGSALTLFALSSVYARVRDRRAMALCTTLVAVCCVKVEVLDLLRPNDYSIWRMAFAKPGTGVDGVPAAVEADLSAIVAVATVWTVATFAAAILSGLHMRNAAAAANANTRANSERDRADQLQTSLSTQRFADAVAAEAHDTLAHSLSLIAVNASALQAQAVRLSSTLRPTDGSGMPSVGPAADAMALARRADEIRRQAAGALDEAHGIIDMLRHPQEAQVMLQPDSDTALTREALYDVIDAARSAGMTLDTWIDVQDLSSLDPDVGKISFRAVQEGLTNARRHAPGQRVSLEISAAKSRGVVILFTNGTAPPVAAVPMGATPDSTNSGGNGLPGLKSRVQQAGGTCEYGYDRQNVFHLDVRLPFTPLR